MRLNEWMRVYCERTQTRGGREWGLTAALSSLFSHAESCVSSVMASISTAQTVTLPLLKRAPLSNTASLAGFLIQFWDNWAPDERQGNICTASCYVTGNAPQVAGASDWILKASDRHRLCNRELNSKDGCSNGWRGAGKVCSLDSGSPCKPLTTSDRLAVGFRVCPGRYHFNHVMIQLKLLAYLISRHYGISFPHWKSPHSYWALWMLSAAFISMAHPDWIYFFLVYIGEWWK